MSYIPPGPYFPDPHHVPFNFNVIPALSLSFTSEANTSPSPISQLPIGSQLRTLTPHKVIDQSFMFSPSQVADKSTPSAWNSASSPVPLQVCGPTDGKVPCTS